MRRIDSLCDEIMVDLLWCQINVYVLIFLAFEESLIIVEFSW